MVTDKSGKIFDDRRKQDRRKDNVNVDEEKRKKDRRKNKKG